MYEAENVRRYKQTDLREAKKAKRRKKTHRNNLATHNEFTDIKFM